MLGNPGKAVAIILLVLQIAGGEEHSQFNSTSFFQTISPYLPFTYAIDALRETVGGIVPEILITKVVVLTLFGLGFIIFGVCMKPVMDPLMRKIAKRQQKAK